MKRRNAIFLLLILVMSSVTQADITVTGADDILVTIQNHSRIITVGGDVTEIVYALGAGDRVVGRDDTSYYPGRVNDLPSVGYMRALAPEGILSLNPTLIIATASSGPPATIEQIRNTGVSLVIIEKDDSHESVINKINMIAKCVGKTDEGKQIATKLNQQRKLLETALEKVKSFPRILFLMNMQRGTLMAAGEKTGANTMINLIRAKNAVSGFSSYKALSAEVAVAGQPDVILVPSHGLSMMGGIEKVSTLPELASTPAVKNKKVLSMDSSFLLMFGPRYLEAAAELAHLVYPDFVIPTELINKEKSE